MTKGKIPYKFTEVFTDVAINTSVATVAPKDPRWQVDANDGLGLFANGSGALYNKVTTVHSF